jgi:uncharacterized membrane protein
VDDDILKSINEMVDAEHQLRRHLQTKESTQEDAERLAELERTLDQYWDLLRQRRADREFHVDPDEAKARPIGEVEGYLQ